MSSTVGGVHIHAGAEEERRSHAVSRAYVKDAAVQKSDIRRDILVKSMHKLHI